MAIGILHRVIPHCCDGCPCKSVCVIFPHQIHWSKVQPEFATDFSSVCRGGPSKEQSSFWVFHNKDENQQHDCRALSTDNAYILCPGIKNAVMLKGLYSRFEKERECKRIQFICLNIVFPKFSTLELINNQFGPSTRILREISSLEPAPKVWTSKSRSKNIDCCF